MWLRRLGGIGAIGHLAGAGRLGPSWPIGLDVGHRELRAMQLEPCGEGVQVAAAARRRLDGHALAPGGLLTREACEAVGGLIGGGRLRGRRIVAAVPAEMCHVKTLRLPAAPAAHLHAMVVEQRADLFPGLDGEAEIRCLVAGEVHQRMRSADGRPAHTLTEVMAMAAARADLDAYVEQLHAAGVTLAALDFGPCALFRGLERFFRRQEDAHEVHVLLDLGEAATQIVIGRGRQVSFYKTLGIGDARLTADAAERLGISPAEAATLRRRVGGADDAKPVSGSVRQALSDATRPATEALVHEVAMCLRYWSVAFRGHRPARLCVTGRGGSDAPLLEALRVGLSVDVEASRPLCNVGRDRMRHLEAAGDVPGEWATALGLSLKTVVGPFRAGCGPSRLAQAEAAQAEQQAEAGRPSPDAGPLRQAA